MDVINQNNRGISSIYIFFTQNNEIVWLAQEPSMCVKVVWPTGHAMVQFRKILTHSVLNEADTQSDT